MKINTLLKDRLKKVDKKLLYNNISKKKELFDALLSTNYIQKLKTINLLKNGN